MKKIILSLFTIYTVAFTAKAQNGFEQALLGSTNDAGKLIQAYFSPGMEGLINSMNNGWYHTAKVHKKFGFDIAISLNTSFIPSDKENFNIQNALGAGSSITSTSPTASTFAGPSGATTFTATRTINGQVVTADFSLPGGVIGDFPLKAVPAPAVQASIGLPYKFEVTARFFPETSLGGDGKIGMFGIGLKKEITEWFGPLDKLPLHVSLLAAYSSLDMNYGFGNTTAGSLQIENGGAEFGLSAFTFQALASLNFPIINVYGGIGYNSGSADLKMNGTYTGTFTHIGGTETASLTPPNLAFDSNGFKTTLGARLSLGFFKLFADYTLQEYNALNLGLAFSFR